MSDFEKAAQQSSPTGFFGEFFAFLKENKKWWMLPVVVVLMLFGVLVFLAGTGAAPFIYTLF